MAEDGSPPARVGPVLSSELLGFPGDARVLIVNCDDFGLYEAVNPAVVEALEEGIASSCSLMVPCPGASQAMRMLGRRPHIPFGIHLTLVCELPAGRWGPLAAKDLVPSLLDEARELFVPTPAGRARFLAQARLEEVELEFRAQIDTVLAAGLAPTHLDWHCLADGGREDIFDLTVALGEEYGLAVRVWLEPSRHKMRRRGLPGTDHPFLDSFSLDIDGKAARYAELLRSLPAGLTEWAVHPALGGPEARAVDPDGWRVRRTDYEFLLSPQAREVLRQEEVTVIDYRVLQNRRSRPGA